MIFKSGDKVLFTGDSITDAGRKHPVGEGLWEGVGTGYVRAFDNVMSAVYPDLKIHVMNTGISGNTSRDLLARFDSDVLALNPDYLFIMIGANDVWRRMDEPCMTSKHVYLDEFEDNVTKMLKKAKQSCIKQIFVIPCYFIEKQKDDMRLMIDEYASATKKICEREGVTVIDVQPDFEEYLRYRPSASLTWDRVHPGPIGSMIIARKIINSIGLDRKF